MEFAKPRVDHTAHIDKLVRQFGDRIPRERIIQDFSNIVEQLSSKAAVKDYIGILAENKARIMYQENALQ